MESNIDNIIDSVTTGINNDGSVIGGNIDDIIDGVAGVNCQWIRDRMFR